TILTSEKSSIPSSLNPPSRIICHVCQKQFSQYTCPRCNSRYCSLQCYKSHSVRCTESFMRENVVEELQQLQSDDETKHKMLQILKRFHSEDEMGSMDGYDSTLSDETVQKILSGDEVNFEDLTLEEKKLFHRAVASGELSKMIEPWDPWWLKLSAKTISLSKEGTQLVQPLAMQDTPLPSENDLESNQLNDFPSGPETPLPPVSKLSSKTPSLLLPVHLVDIIYSYCFTLRLYNGDTQSDAIGSAMLVLSISSILSQNGQPETVLEALSYGLEQTCSPAYRHMGGLQFGFALVDDVISILSLGSSALICLLCDVQRIIQAGERELKMEKARKSRVAEVRSKLKLADRKIYYIMCWVHEQPYEAWVSLAATVRTEKCLAMNYGGSRTDLKFEDKAKAKGKCFVEEMK
ncbi:zf-HIT domain-containing protein/SHQ1 domain-containing protein, partial [Cephalotus follicularis]